MRYLEFILTDLLIFFVVHFLLTDNCFCSSDVLLIFILESYTTSRILISQNYFLCLGGNSTGRNLCFNWWTCDHDRFRFRLVMLDDDTARDGGQLNTVLIKFCFDWFSLDADDVSSEVLIRHKVLYNVGNFLILVGFLVNEFENIQVIIKIIFIEV